METVIKYLFFFIAAYTFWLATGGVERAEERRAENKNSIIIEHEPVRDLRLEAGDPFDEFDDEGNPTIFR